MNIQNNKLIKKKKKKRIASIKAPSARGITIAHIMHDDRQTGEYLLQDDFSAQGVWYKTLDDLKAEWRSVGFMVAHCLRMKCNTPTLVFPGEKFGNIVLGYHEEELE